MRIFKRKAEKFYINIHNDLDNRMLVQVDIWADLYEIPPKGNLLIVRKTHLEQSIEFSVSKLSDETTYIIFCLPDTEPYEAEGNFTYPNLP